MLGGGAQDEEMPPGPDDIQPNFFQFFGFGQPGNGPNGQLGFHENRVNQVPLGDNNIGGDNQAENWGIWPNDQSPVAQVPVAHVPVAQQPVGLEQPIPGEPFIELNDLINQDADMHGLT